MGGCSKILLGHFYEMLNILWVPQLEPVQLAPLLSDLGEGSGCPVTEMHGMPPSRPRGCVQANYQQLIPNLQFMCRTIYKLHE